MLRKALLSLALLLCVATLAFAAELAGRWQGKLVLPDGNEMEIVYNLKVEGQTLTGTVGSAMGEVPISEGRVKGDSIFFRIDIESGPLPHSGVVSGDSLHMQLHLQDGQTLPLSLGRVPAK